MIHLLWMFLLLNVSGQTADPLYLNPFVTDYCTGYVEGTREQPDLWKHCCVEHDLYLWAGGSYEDREITDLRLKSCVEVTGQKIQAILIYTAVKIGSYSPIHIKDKQWGNGWIKREHYLKLTELETEKIRLHLNSVEASNVELSTELKRTFLKQIQTRLETP